MRCEYFPGTYGVNEIQDCAETRIALETGRPDFLAPYKKCDSREHGRSSPGARFRARFRFLPRSFPDVGFSAVLIWPVCFSQLPIAKQPLGLFRGFSSARGIRDPAQVYRGTGDERQQWETHVRHSRGHLVRFGRGRFNDFHAEFNSSRYRDSVLVQSSGDSSGIAALPLGSHSCGAVYRVPRGTHCRMDGEGTLFIIRNYICLEGIAMAGCHSIHGCVLLIDLLFWAGPSATALALDQSWYSVRCTSVAGSFRRISHLPALFQYIHRNLWISWGLDRSARLAVRYWAGVSGRRRG